MYIPDLSDENPRVHIQTALWTCSTTLSFSHAGDRFALRVGTSRAGPQLSTTRTVRSENAKIPDAQVAICSQVASSPEILRLIENSTSGSGSHGRQRHV